MARRVFFTFRKEGEEKKMKDEVEDAHFFRVYIQTSRAETLSVRAVHCAPVCVYLMVTCGRRV